MSFNISVSWLHVGLLELDFVSLILSTFTQVLTYLYGIH